jgi:hypothetical protein
MVRFLFTLDLIALVETMKSLQAAGATQGDICERKARVPGSSIQLIDFAELAPNYDNDVVAMSHFLK